MSDRDKEVEILALRHQITVLERQLGKTRPRFSLADRAFLAALLHRLPRDVLGRFRLLVRPETVLRSGTCWRAATRPDPAAGARAGRAPSAPSACWCCAWHERIPAGATAASTAKNLVMDLEDAGSRARFLIRDRDGKFPGLFDAVLKDAGIETVLSGVQMPRMNSIMERWVQTCRRELLTVPGSGTSGTCCTPCASSSSSTIPTGLTRESRTPGRCSRCPHRSPGRLPPAVSTYTDAIASVASSTSTGMPLNLHG